MNISADAAGGKSSKDVAIASQWQLTRWAFRKHKLAILSLWVIGILYLISIFAEFVSPFDPTSTTRRKWSISLTAQRTGFA